MPRSTSRSCASASAGCCTREGSFSPRSRSTPMELDHENVACPAIGRIVGALWRLDVALLAGEPARLRGGDRQS